MGSFIQIHRGELTEEQNKELILKALSNARPYVGLTQEQIAKETNLSKKTIINHLRSLYEKKKVGKYYHTKRSSSYFVPPGKGVGRNVNYIEVERYNPSEQETITASGSMSSLCYNEKKKISDEEQEKKTKVFIFDAAIKQMDELGIKEMDVALKFKIEDIRDNQEG